MLMVKEKKLINYTAMRWNANIGSVLMLFISLGLALIYYCQLCFGYTHTHEKLQTRWWMNEKTNKSDDHIMKSNLCECPFWEYFVGSEL